jgi:16S rRNA (guanine527-N7)-methyltransferase
MVSRETPPELPLWLAEHEEGLTAYRDLLATRGVERGLIGPREADRLWQRHILNCAVVVDSATDLVPAGSRVADVGSGAGLPGLVWALCRPDLRVVLVEPLLRRATFLSETVAELGVSDRVQIVRGRAEDVVRGKDWTAVDVVTARAVAPLPKLLGWTVPLLAPGGHLVALKGSSAEEEVASAAADAERLQVSDLMVRTLSAPYLEQPTTVITGRRRTAQ